MQESMIKRFTWWIGAVILAALSWQAGRFTWLAWSGDDGPVISGTMPDKDAGQQLKNSYQAWHLFGQPETVKARVAEVRQNAPVTRLNLQLMGVVVGGVAADSGAIIAEKGRSAEYYKVEDSLPGNAKLVDVYADHVLLSRSGVLEKLSFDETDTQQSAMSISATNSPADLRPSDIETPEQFLHVAQARLNKDPAGALASVGLAPADGSNGTSGYVYDGKNPMLAAMNMQRGDVIRSVNGHLLGNMQQDQSKLQEFYESGTLEVEIERAGATFTITYPIP